MTFVPLPFPAGSLDLYHARFTRVYEGHFMPCYREEISRVEPLDSAAAEVIGLHDWFPLLRSASRFVEIDTSVICQVLVDCFGSFLFQDIF